MNAETQALLERNERSEWARDVAHALMAPWGFESRAVRFIHWENCYEISGRADGRNVRVQLWPDGRQKDVIWRD